jgi:hypothetical protein
MSSSISVILTRTVRTRERRMVWRDGPIRRHEHGRLCFAHNTHTAARRRPIRRLLPTRGPRLLRRQGQPAQSLRKDSARAPHGRMSASSVQTRQRGSWNPAAAVVQRGGNKARRH